MTFEPCDHHLQAEKLARITPEHWEAQGMKPVSREALKRALAWLEALAARLRNVIVVSGDWSRVVTDGSTAQGSTVGIFLDPPYGGDVRDRDLYATEDHSIAKDVRDWAIERGEDRRYRIVLAGYDLEHEDVMPSTWRRVRWLSSGSYQTSASAERGDGNSENRHREVLWCSPGCLDPTPTLF